jgi:hypothetical protein
MTQFNDYDALQFQISGALTTGSLIVFPMPYPGEVVSASATLGTAPTGTDLHVNFYKNGAGTLAAPVALSSIAISGNVATATTGTAHGLTVGQGAVIQAATTASNNGTWVVTSVPSTTTFTYAVTPAVVAQAGAGGTVNVAGQSKIVFPDNTRCAYATAGTVYSTYTALAVPNGVSLWGSGAVNGTVSPTSPQLATPVVPLGTFVAGDTLGVKVDQVGSTIAGSTLTVTALVIKK